MSAFLRWCVLAAAAAIATPSGAQESYPSRPVRLLVGVAPGSTADVSLRILAQKLSQILGGQFVVENRVHPSLGVSNVGALIALAKLRPGEIFYASSGVGTSPHLSAELFNLMAGVKLSHVPYQGKGIAARSDENSRISRIL